LLALLMTGSALIACGSDAGETKDTAALDTTPVTEAVTEAGVEYVADSLPSNLDFGGRQFTMYVASYKEFFGGPEESSGDVVEDSVIDRNRAVEERLNVKLEYFFDSNAQWDTIAGILSKYIMAGDTTYDLYTGQQYGITTLLAGGGFVNAYDLDHLDFSKPWWNNRYMDELAIGNNSRYFLVGDFFISALLSTHVVYFNKTMYGKLHEDPNELYYLVLDGKWTLDKMAQVAKDAYVDLNNNGKTDIDDQLGYVTYKPAASVDPFMYLSDIEFTPRDSEGYLTIDLYNEACVDLTTKVVEYFHQPGSLYDTESGACNASFKNGKAQFLGINTVSAAKAFRDMTDDFSFLPYPKLTEEQEHYNCVVADIVGPGAIPGTSLNLDMAGAVIEALSSESYRTVVPTYYETALKIKYSRDDLTSQIIDVVHDASYTDFMYAYSSSLSGIGVIMRELVSGNSTDYMSKVSKKQKAVDKALDKLITTFEEQN
ncbi:MAG: hypothetical protein IKZ09_06930, partial [Clostridia bacterium]|nr:hypothetical protein [Clostridia bacterium]